MPHSVLQDLAHQAPLKLPAFLTEKLLHFDDFEKLRANSLAPKEGVNLFQRMLRSLDLQVTLAESTLTRIPKTGATLVVANHPFGLAEGPILGDLLLRVRPDIKFMVNGLLGVFPELKDWIINVDPFGGEGSQKKNAAGLRQAMQWLRQGGLLVIFPAGEVSSFRWKGLQVADPAWNPAAVRLAINAQATVVPLYFDGANSPLFHAAGMVHPRFRTALIPREFFGRSGGRVELKIGSPVPPAKLNEFADAESAMEYLRRRVYLMGRPYEIDLPHPILKFGLKQPQPLSVGLDEDAVAAELEQLPDSNRLIEARDYLVLLATAGEIPKALNEIGRLREVTFRGVGEGSGKAIDLDRFDSHYQHLILYHRRDRKIAGAYRLADTRKLPRRSVNDLYTSTLFKMDARFLDRLGPAIELGRSFIRVEYQRSFQPLLLLWQGIGRYVAQNPEACRLFGPVSISGNYGKTCLELMVSYLLRNHRETSLAPLVGAKKPFRLRPLVSRSARLVAGEISTIDEFCSVVSDTDQEMRSIPVLLRQYLNLGGKVLQFNVDPDFNDCVDGLVLVDLRQTDRKSLERYMGKQGAETFAEFHASVPNPLTA